jgi:predicted AlkP superfamily pyrophosphatase or phosphodiesterase
MSKITNAFLILAALLAFSACKNPAAKAPPTSFATSTEAERTYPDRVNSLEQINKPVVLMISIDGFRNDYLEMYQPPTLLKWAKSGVRANGLVPSFPTLTFPNHYTLVTGLRPGHHGIINNRFYDEIRKQSYALGDNVSVNDGTWYRGNPIWKVAEDQGMLTGICYWVGSEAKIGGVDPTYYKIYEDHKPGTQRIAWIKEWLTLPENKKPHFLGLYFSKVDTAGHKFGPKSEEVKNAVLEIDSHLAELDQFIEAQKIDLQIVVVSDHGMKTFDQTVDISPLFDKFKMKANGRGPVVMLYADDKSTVNKIYKAAQKIKGPFKVYKANKLPKRWALDDKDRRGDIILVGDLGTYISYKDKESGKEYSNTTKAGHGWDTQNTQELNGVFIATGSQFKKGQEIPAFDNIHVYPMLLKILDLKSESKVDGDIKVLSKILK